MSQPTEQEWADMAESDRHQEIVALLERIALAVEKRAQGVDDLRIIYSGGDDGFLISRDGGCTWDKLPVAK